MRKPVDTKPPVELLVKFTQDPDELGTTYIRADAKMNDRAIDEIRNIILARMQELEIGYLCFNYGGGMIGALDFDGEEITEGVSLAYVFEEARHTLKRSRCATGRYLTED